MELIQHPEEEATPEGRVVLFFPRAREPMVRDWGKLYEKTKQEQSCFGKDALSEAWPEEKACAVIF